MKKTQRQWKLETKVGPLYLIASELGVSGILWRMQNVPMLESLKSESPSAAVLRKVVTQLHEYFAGQRTTFELPTDVDGTEFQKKVWKELGKIPFGHTCSYSDIARKIRNEKAVRAVGTANGKNPISIIVPCHRVIAADGSLGGYAGGLKVKTYLLELEKRRQK